MNQNRLPGIAMKTYTARPVTDLIQVVDFTGLIEVYHEVASSLLSSSSCDKSVKTRGDAP